MSRPPLDRDEVVGILAALGDRRPEQVDDAVGSLELTWLISEVEQRYGIVVDLSVEEMDTVKDVDAAVRVLGALLVEGR